MREYVVCNWCTKWYKPLSGQSHEVQQYMLSRTCQSASLENIKYNKQQPLVQSRATLHCLMSERELRIPLCGTLPQMPSFKPPTCLLFEHFLDSIGCTYKHTYLSQPNSIVILTFHTYNCVLSYGFYTCFGQFLPICAHTQQMIPNSLYT